MNTYWITFTDGSGGCCQGQGEYDAARIAEHITKKTVVVGKDRCKPEGVKSLPYPANPIIWQFDHPIHGKTPNFCFGGKECAGRTACPRNYSCCE